ncbi:MAG: thioredoxin domain-containing protein [Chloroflexi bacterium]|nr:MAG: thioredoxin domain-containing protein [Chloroflexota bacterium]
MRSVTEQAERATAEGEFHFSPRPNRAAEIAWRPWGERAFQEAQVTDKPVLLAISAVWCHWCHVMDETSYSDPEVIKLVNDRYVAVRVDNDQRPDVNRRYNMGGWPTTAFLTPDGEVIHGGTYVPPEAMRSYLDEISDVWRDQRGDVAKRVAEMREKEREARASQPGDLSAEIVDAVGSIIRGQYDPQFGGFGREPKFPQPKILRFLLDEHRRHGYPELATMLHKTLGAMAGGGMYDHVEGGFFRYSTTRQWEVPHFEKMLEDNAELLAVFAEAHRSFPGAGYDRVVRDVVRWMDATLWDTDGAYFAGSQDADEHYYSLEAAERAKHGAPYVDRTLYASWNELAASAYWAAFNALGDARLDERAQAVVRTVGTRLWDREAKSLYHYDRGEGRRLPDLLGDLVASLAANLDAYETGLHPGALGGARRTALTMRERLEDAETGGFWDRPAGGEPGRLGTREKPIEENALAADGLLRLAALTGDDRWRETAVRALRAFVGEYRRWGQFAAAYAGAVARALAEPLLITVVGPGDDETANALWRAARAAVHPARAIERLEPARDADRIGALALPKDRVAAYVCVGTVCSAPLADEAALALAVAEAAAKVAGRA